MRVKLTDRFVKSAAAGARGFPIFMDDGVIGFGVQVRQSGRKSFTLDYSFDGHRRRLYIGDFPDWSTTAARDQAKSIKRQIDQGIDPVPVGKSNSNIAMMQSGEDRPRFDAPDGVDGSSHRRILAEG
jgi:hypothetical protein